jgi:hypothetical protein
MWQYGQQGPMYGRQPGPGMAPYGAPMGMGMAPPPFAPRPPQRPRGYYNTNQSRVAYNVPNVKESVKETEERKRSNKVRAFALWTLIVSFVSLMVLALAEISPNSSAIDLIKSLARMIAPHQTGNISTHYYEQHALLTGQPALAWFLPVGAAISMLTFALLLLRSFLRLTTGRAYTKTLVVSGLLFIGAVIMLVGVALIFGFPQRIQPGMITVFILSLLVIVTAVFSPKDRFIKKTSKYKY